MSHVVAPPNRRQINLIVMGLVLGLFLSALDQMIVATAIRTIGDDLNGLTLQAWVTTAYMVAATISTPLYGKLSDMYGRKPLYLISISLFVLGSLLCGTATSMYQLAAYRGIQGAGAGGLMALALIILADILTPRERTKYQGAFFAVWGVASVLGPVLGGFFAGADELLGLAGWRWIFLINVPLGALGIVVIMRVLHLPRHPNPSVRVDWWGVTTIAAAILPLLVVVEQGRYWGWTSPAVLGLSALCIASAVAFVFAERAAGDDALLPLRMFRIPTVSVSTWINFIMGFAMFGGMASLPLYLQISKGMSPTVAGLMMLPFTGGIILMSTIASITIRRNGRYRWLPIFGTALLVIAGLYLSRMEATSSLWHLTIGGILFGMGLGAIMQPIMLAVQNAVEPRDIGVGSSSVMFFRQIGGSLGTAVFLSLLFSSVPGRISDAFKAAAGTPQFQAVVENPEIMAQGKNAAVIEVLNSGSLEGAAQAGISLDNTSFLGELHPVLAAPFQEGFAGAITAVLLLSTAVAFVGFILTWRLPEEPLRDKSGIESRAEAAAL